MLLAAGMLAFLGAIICIIASVHPAGTAAPAAAAPSAAADNDSAAAALLPAADKGLGALHGPAEALASAGPRLPGGPPPPLFSRFVCTPLSAECPATGTGPAAGPGPEELLALRSAAAQLRRTALEQKERIRMDQETIRELTGKLSRCEGGLRTPPAAAASPAAAAAAAAGLRAAPRPGTMGHPPAEPPAVRELEEAVRALQDRIDRIEVRGMLPGVGGRDAARSRGRDAPGGRGGDAPGEDASHTPFPRPAATCTPNQLLPILRLQEGCPCPALARGLPPGARGSPSAPFSSLCSRVGPMAPGLPCFPPSLQPGRAPCLPCGAHQSLCWSRSAGWQLRARSCPLAER